MAQPTHLLQEIKGQKPFLYSWTAQLAKKDGMRPLSAEQAKRFRETGKVDPTRATTRSDLEKLDDLETIPPMIDVEEDFYLSEDDQDQASDNKILDTLKPNAAKTSPVDGEARPLVTTQEDILNREAEKIASFKKRASVEEYILRKYQIEMIPMDRLEEMQQQAVDLLSTLASTESLHE